MNDMNGNNDNSNNLDERQDDLNKDINIQTSNDEEKPQKNVLNEFCDMVESVLFSIFTVILVFTFLFKIASVEGTSMVPTLEDKDKLIVSSTFITIQSKRYYYHR